MPLFNGAWDKLERIVVTETWLIFLFIGVLLLFGVLQIGFRKRIKLIFEAFLSNRFVDQLAREERASGSPSNLILVVIYIINLSLLVSFMFSRFSDDFDNISNGLFFLAISGLIIAFMLFKWLSTAFIGWLFDYEELAIDLLFQRFLVHGVLGFVLFPVTLFIGFHPALTSWFIYLGFLILLVFFITRLIRLVYRTITIRSFPFKYIILYICGLEILPVLVLSKVIYNYL